MSIPHCVSNTVVRTILVTMLQLAACAAQDVETALPTGEKWRVRLLAPLSTNFNRKGDMVSAQVLEPAAFHGAILEGVIRDLKAGGESGRVSSIQFDFLTLHTADKAFQVSAVLVEVLNVRREPGVDDGGSMLESGAPGLGGKLAGTFSRGASATLHLASRSTQLVFAPGSEFVLQLQPRKPSRER